MPDVPGPHMRIARVLHQDDEFVTLEVPKDMSRKLRLEDGDAFWTLIFVHQPEGGEIESWLPWAPDGDT